MLLLRNMTLKNLALTAISFLSAMMSILAFSFGVAGNVLEKPINAINWLFKSASFHAWEISGLGTFLIAFSLPCNGYIVTYMSTKCKIYE